MKAIINYKDGQSMVFDGPEMKTIYDIIRRNPEMTAAIVWRDNGEISWAFQRKPEHIAVIDMRHDRPVRHCYDKYQFRLIGGEIA